MRGKDMEKSPEETVREVIMLMFLEALVEERIFGGIEVQSAHTALRSVKGPVREMSEGGPKRLILPTEAGRIAYFDEFVGEMEKTMVLYLHVENAGEIITFTHWAPQIIEQLLKDLVDMSKEEHEALRRLCQSAVKVYKNLAVRRTGYV